MAVIKQGVLGSFSGKIGNIVGSSWKGIGVMKSRPASVANPQTPAQVAQREKFSGIVAVARLLLASIIGPYWNRFAQRQSGYNAFISQNIDTFVGNVFTNFSNFFSMRGPLLGAAISSAVADDSSNTVTVNWVNNAGTADALASDEAVIVYYNQTKNYWRSDAAGAIRSAGTRVISDSVMTTGDVLHIYLGFSRPDESKVSDSSYLTTTVVA